MLRRLLISIGLAAVFGALLAVPARADDDYDDRRGGGRGGNTGLPVQVLLSRNRIVTVTTGAPDRAVSRVTVRGLQRGEELVGIDRRPLDGLVYGVAHSRRGTNVYTIDQAGRATLAFALTRGFLDPNDPGTGAPIVLDGDRFGVDFNPAADALRIVSDEGQNLRALPSARNVVFNGTPFPRPAGTTFVDGNLTSEGVTAAAYSNNDNDPATGTTLMDIDTDDDVLFDQNPPNDGTLVNPRPLGIRVSDRAAFDIVTANGTNTAYAVLDPQGRRTDASLVTIDLATGSVTFVGEVAGDPRVLGMAL